LIFNERKYWSGQSFAIAMTEKKENRPALRIFTGTKNRITLHPSGP